MLNLLQLGHIQTVQLSVVLDRGSIHLGSHYVFHGKFHREDCQILKVTDSPVHSQCMHQPQTNAHHDFINPFIQASFDV
jgi:hypothetical protein